MRPGEGRSIPVGFAGLQLVDLELIDLQVVDIKFVGIEIIAHPGTAVEVRREVVVNANLELEVSHARLLADNKVDAPTPVR